MLPWHRDSTFGAWLDRVGGAKIIDMISFRFRACLFAAILLGIVVPSLVAQSPASLQGHATDAIGRPVSHAVVQLVSDQTAHAGRTWRYTLMGDSLGKFSQEGLAPGAYLVMLFTDGRATDVLRRVQLTPGGTQQLDLSLGSATLQVAGAASMPARPRASVLTR